MGRYLVFIAVFATGLVAGERLPDRSTPPSSEDSLVCFLAGVELLKAGNLDDASKTSGYRSLMAVTGVNGRAAIEYLKQFRDRPSALQSIQERVLAIVENASGPGGNDSVADIH